MSDPTQQRRDLKYWSNRLEEHFSELRAERDRLTDSAPIFALEHGLQNDEIASLANLIGESVRQGQFSSDLSLPLAVFAAEVGYEYTGIEYWFSFEARVLGWRKNSDRTFVRDSLRDFSRRFGGAIPKGTWADHFSIICWPITHSILPTDLQRQLARSLFEARGEWSKDLLEDPASLGTALAARSWRNSGRYQVLTENADLLGLIASALLAENEGSSPFLTSVTLRRLVKDLATERQAKVWLLGARTAAQNARIRGIRAVSDKSPDPATSSAHRGTRRLAPRISVRSSEDGWQPFVEIPDFSSLVGSNPELADELARRRVIVAGAEQPEATGTLGAAGLLVRLRSWPRTGTDLFELEGAKADINAVLADECSLSDGPPWLFRLGSDDRGIEVRGRAVMPGERYLVVLEARPVGTYPSWVVETPLSVEGASAWILDCPSSFEQDDISLISSFDLWPLEEIRAEPVGVTAPFWDGSGGGEWLVDETPMLRISLTRPANLLICRVSGEEACFEPTRTATGIEVLLRFPDLEVGDHTVSIFIVDQAGSEPKEVGTIEIAIRQPALRLPVGSPREGMAIIVAPANPTLEEMWSGRGLLHIQGPAGISARLSLTLLDSRGVPVPQAERHRTVRLPVTRTDWPQVFNAAFRNSPELERRYLEASGCRIAVGNAQLGEVELECFRRFSPLALRPSARGVGYLEVVNNTGRSADIAQYEFGYPDRRVSLNMPPDSILKPEGGGLVVANVGSDSAATIFMQELDFESFQNLGKMPQLKERKRSVEAVQSLMELASHWEGADLPPNPIAHAQREKVCEAVSQEVWALLGGTRWRVAERKFRREDEGFTVANLLGAIGRKDREQVFARRLRSKLNSISAPSAGDRVRCLAEMLASDGEGVGLGRYRVGFAEFVLKMATDPGHLIETETPEHGNALRDLFRLPGLFRAVRFVLLTEVDQVDDAKSAQDRI